MGGRGRESGKSSEINTGAVSGIYTFSFIRCLTLGAGEEIHEVVGRAIGMGWDGRREAGDRTVHW